MQHGFEDRRVADVGLLAAKVVLDLDREYPEALGPLRSAEKTMEDGVPVKARERSTKLLWPRDR